jgi:hypothetical protein
VRYGRDGDPRRIGAAVGMVLFTYAATLLALAVTDVGVGVVLAVGVFYALAFIVAFAFTPFAPWRGSEHDLRRAMWSMIAIGAAIAVVATVIFVATR